MVAFRRGQLTGLDAHTHPNRFPYTHTDATTDKYGYCHNNHSNQYPNYFLHTQQFPTSYGYKNTATLKTW